jgi:hypothetical protein
VAGSVGAGLGQMRYYWRIPTNDNSMPYLRRLRQNAIQLGYCWNLGLQTISICARKNIKALKYKAFEFANSIRTLGIYKKPAGTVGPPIAENKLRTTEQPYD